MLDIPNKINTPQHSALEVLKTSKAYKCQGFPIPPFANPKTENNISAQQKKFFPRYLFLEVLSMKCKITFKKICHFTFIYSDSNGTKYYRAISNSFHSKWLSVHHV